LLATWQTFLISAFRLHLIADVQHVVNAGVKVTVIMAATYLTVGAVARARRLRRKRAEIDRVAANWLHAGGVVMAAALIAGGIAAAIDMKAFVSGGFRPYIAVAMVGGSVCLVLAMTRTRFGDLDQTLRRGRAELVANAVGAALYLAVIVGLGGAEVLSGARSLTVALGSTALALITFGPLRGWVKGIAEDRLADERARARRMLKQAAEAAVGTLDAEVLHRGVVTQVAQALKAEGASLYERGDSPEPGDPRWMLAAYFGAFPLGRELLRKDPIAEELDRRVKKGTAGPVAAGTLAAPIPVDGAAMILVIAPSAARPLDDEDRELVETLCAGLAVAMANARAHTELLGLSERLKEEIEQSERRRKEIAKLKDRLEEEKRFLEAELTRRGGRSPVIGAGLRPTYELVQKVSRADASVLVRGETGVGKELVARGIHAGSARRDQPFVVVDCGAVAAGLFESTLFGHEKGAFTGATRATLGAFRAAHGGTIFLDEIGELPLDLQPKLLRALQEKEVMPVGGERPVPVDVRVVAGTNRDLSAEVDEGRFREDLLYRLRVIEIVVPPLRARKKDIPELAETFLAEIAARRALVPKKLAPDAIAALMDHDWPGNVRELEHAVEAAALYAVTDLIHATDLPIAGEVFKRRAAERVAAAGPAGPSGLRETLEELEKERLVQALRDAGGNRSAAARALGLSRGALLRRMERYGVEA
jgi:transcriptional regulator with GAF, ATPase, and Fis domain